MNWEAIGAVGELISAFAVLATLIYLAIQIRHVSEQSWSQNINSSTSQNQKVVEMQSKPEIAAALHKAIFNQELSELDGIYLESYISMAFLSYEAQFNHYKKGINTPNWDNCRNVISHFLVIPWMARWWDEFGKNVHNPEFVNEVESIVKEIPGDPMYLRRVNANDT